MALQRRRVVGAGAAMRRSLRNPNHPFSIKVPPFCIQPFFIAPVLPGETMKNLRMQARVVSDPIKNRLIGAHVEFFLFYVKLRDLDIRNSITDLLLDPTFDAGTIDTPAADVKLFHPSGVGQINYVKACQDVVVRNFFRDELDDETQYTVTNGTYTWPVAQINQNNPFDSAFTQTEEGNVDVGVTVGVDDVVTASEINDIMERWAMLRQANLTEMSYEDYLGTFGVKMKAEEAHIPELVRYVREWTYPTNTVEPSTGVPTSAYSWTVQVSADKDRFFREPGFLFGVTVTRPKLYLRNQTGTFTASMGTVKTWLPALMQHAPEHRRILIPDNIGPYQANTESMVFDIADLFMYGEQFLNYALASTTDNLYPLPSADLQNKRYPTTWASIQELFAGTTPASMIQMDGIVSMSIATSLKDLSPRGGPTITL